MLMNRLLFFILLIGSATETRAQLPVVDVAVLAETIATVAELQRQVDLLLKEVALSTEIKQNTQTHLKRYERALAKRGLIPTEPLDSYVHRMRQAHQAYGSMIWETPDILPQVFPMYQDIPDPRAARRATHGQTMATLQGTLASLHVHSQSIDQAHRELEQMKMEIVQAKEPQQIRDVQANLQVVQTRELLLTRQAFMALVNLEAIRAADAVSRDAQQRMSYDALVGEATWLQPLTHYDVSRFLKRPDGP